MKTIKALENVGDALAVIQTGLSVKANNKIDHGSTKEARSLIDQAQGVTMAMEVVVKELRKIKESRS